jgi:hypothetical protein
MLTGKNVPPVVKNKILMKEEHYHHHSGDVAVSAWQEKM